MMANMHLKANQLTVTGCYNQCHDGHKEDAKNATYKTKLRIKMMNSERIPSQVNKYAFILYLPFASCYISNPLYVQAQGEMQKEAQLSAQQLKALEGYYPQ